MAWFKLRTNSGRPLHPGVEGLANDVLKGTVSRREFLRTAALLGVSVASAKLFLGEHGLLAPSAALAQEAPKKGGTLRFSCNIQEMTDPATISWAEAANLLRNSVEFLTEVDSDNITHPYLAESWDPSPDLKTWTFKLRQNVKWSNGDAFTADDAIYNLKRWIDPNSKSSNRTSFEAISGLEKVSDHEFKVILSRPLLALPEMLYAYTCCIVHRSFDESGANWPKNPIGTGPFEMTEYAVGQKATFKRKEGYWGEAALLDEIRYIDLGQDIAAHVAALASGQVDLLYRITNQEIDLVKRLPNVEMLSGKSAQTLCLRMQVDAKPFDDKRIRQAVVLAADNQKILDLAYRGLGIVGQNHHVAPVHPEYAELPPIKRDVAKAKALLAEAGHPDGIDLELVVGNTQGKFEQDTCQVLQQQAAEAGIRIKLNVMPATEYWNIWDKAPFSATFWTHRPLGVMVMNLAYRSGAIWNETHFSNKDFDTAFDQAMGIVDPKERAKLMATCEKILQEESVMVQPYFADKFTAQSNKVKNFKLHPSDYFKMDKVWLA